MEKQTNKKQNKTKTLLKTVYNLVVLNLSVAINHCCLYRNKHTDKTKDPEILNKVFRGQAIRFSYVYILHCQSVYFMSLLASGGDLLY